MKKLGIIAMACALLLGMSQCKKDNTTTPTNEGEKVRITLNVGSSSAKHEVTPETGVVTFTNGDVLYVASNGVYVGTLTYNGTQFAGDITEPTEGQKLHFYFLGNVNPEETLTEGSTTGCSVVISDQTTNLPVISYNTSRENYQLGKTDYNATLLNKCALVKFNVTSVLPDSPICLMGMNNKVTVDFTTNEFTYDQANDGIITFAAGNGEHWAILLPQGEVAHAVAHSYNGLWEGTSDAIPAIAENDYLTDGLDVTIDHPTGAINSKFTINAAGDQVYFSKGNLQYIGSAAAPYWKFADNQWDYLGSTTGQNSSSENVDRDLFGWGTSGYNHGAVNYQPWSISNTNNLYYAYGDNNANLYDQTGQADWGYNAINNGGNMENNGWHTPTLNDWEYVFNERTTTSGIRYAKAKVNNKNGVILLPDDWDITYYTLNSINTYTAGYADNSIDAETWAVYFEANGAVFLPAAGKNDNYLNSIGSFGGYWASTHTTGYSGYSDYVWFNASWLYVATRRGRSDCLSVRLVFNVNNIGVKQH